MDNLNPELADQLHTVARINQDKYAALAKLYRGVSVMTALLTVTQEFDRINAVVQKEAKSRPGKAIFIDTYTMFAGENGGFTEYLENAKGDPVKVRAGDGVHFDTAGGEMIAREVLKRLNELFDLTSWRNKKPA